MDSDHHHHGDAPGEKSLPGGMGLPRWMKKSAERYDYTEFCASPPTDDGFFHFGQKNAIPNQRPVSAGRVQPDCSSIQQQKWTGFEVGNSNNVNNINRVSLEPGNKFLKDCKAPETSSFFRTLSSTSFVNSVSTQAALLVLPTNDSSKDNGAPLCTNNKPMESSSSHKKLYGSETQLSVVKHDFTDTAPTALENSMPSTMITFTDDYDERKVDVIKNKELVSKLNLQKQKNKEKKNTGSLLVVPQDDRDTSTTPNSTPGVSPSSSPQIARRENPFFTGSSQNSSNNKNTNNTSSSSNWLFRSASTTPESERNRGSSGNFLYEYKTDAWKSNSSQSGSNKPRFVPKPSELRELNFWSPTSM